MSAANPKCPFDWSWEKEAELKALGGKVIDTDHKAMGFGAVTKKEGNVEGKSNR